jgi:uncharacterized protein YggU (UPF0235/DUF167 family)
MNYREIKDGIVLTVYVKPSSKRNLITVEEEVVAETKEPASQSKAYIAVIKALAKLLGIPSVSIRIVRGCTDDVKQILIVGLAPDELERRLKLN